MKALDDTYVPVTISSDNVTAMINHVIQGHQISFCDDEFPFEEVTQDGVAHHCRMP